MVLSKKIDENELQMSLAILKSLKPNTKLQIKSAKNSPVFSETIICNDPFSFEFLCNSSNGAVTTRPYQQVFKILTDNEPSCDNSLNINANTSEECDLEQRRLTKKAIKHEVWKHFETTEVAKPYSQLCLICKKESNLEIVKKLNFIIR